MASATMMQPAAASLRSATNDPVVAMLNEVDAEVQVLETRVREMDGAERYPDTTRGLEYTNDLDEGVMEEGVPVYEATINEGGKKFVEEGFGYSGEHEEGTLVEGVPAFDMDQKRPNKKLTRQEAEALASKEANIATGFEYCATEEEGQMEDGVPAYEVQVCAIM